MHRASRAVRNLQWSRLEMDSGTSTHCVRRARDLDPSFGSRSRARTLERLLAEGRALWLRQLYSGLIASSASPPG